MNLLNQYGIKGTFFLNSGTFGLPGTLTSGGVTVNYSRIEEQHVNMLYTQFGHEVASHSLTHADQRLMDIQQIADEINVDVANLERITGNKVIGYAYPGGFLTSLMYDGAKNHSSVKYARGITSTYSFGAPSDWYEWTPTCHFLDSQAPTLANQFMHTFPMTDQLFYVWGHSFECDLKTNAWASLESLLQQISGDSNVRYYTNGQVYEYYTNRYGQ